MEQTKSLPLISVIVPVYNVQDYLARCLDSILTQTYQNLEIILVNDGSRDGSLEICNAYQVNDARVRVIDKPNGGVSAARNAGLDAASGKYILFVDSDDYIDACMYEKMMEQVQAYDCDIVMCDCLKEHGDHTEPYTHDIRAGFYNIDQLRSEYYPHLLMMENVEYPATISNCLLLFRRELAVDIRYLVGVRYSEDLLFGAQLLYRANSFYYLKGEAFYHYVMNPTSATHKFVPDKWNDYCKLHQQVLDTFSSCQDFDFSHQIDLCLLFFLYNTVDELYGADSSAQEKHRRIQEVLRTHNVREMFSRINVMALPISWKQKALTLAYKYQLGIVFLIAYYGG